LAAWGASESSLASALCVFPHDSVSARKSREEAEGSERAMKGWDRRMVPGYDCSQLL